MALAVDLFFFRVGCFFFRVAAGRLKKTLPTPKKNLALSFFWGWEFFLGLVGFSFGLGAFWKGSLGVQGSSVWGFTVLGI